MSVELGTPGKTIRYLNLHETGKNDGDSSCTIDSRWSMPIIDKQSDYIVAISRFEVALNRIPMIAALNDCIPIFEYNDDFIFRDIYEPGTNQIVDGLFPVERLTGLSPDSMFTHHDMTREQGIRYMNVCEGVYPFAPNQEDPEYNMTDDHQDGPDIGRGHTINVTASYTVYEFLKKLNSQIKEVLLFNSGLKQIAPTYYVNDDPNDPEEEHYSQNALHPNKFCAPDGTVLNETDTIAQFEIKMSCDFTFRVDMNYAFARKYYIKMSPALFNMLGFTESYSPTFNRLDLPGRRFMGDRVEARDAQGNETGFPAELVDVPDSLQLCKPTYTQTFNNYHIALQLPHTQIGHPGGVPNLEIDRTHIETVIASNFTRKEFWTRFVAPVSAADSINRIKGIVFQSSLATTSEGATGDTYRRQLTDFTVPVKTSFNWHPDTGLGQGISENSASEYTYENPNPSAGRWLMLSDPSPLYELKLTATARCWDFETATFKHEYIPLPPGATFSVKLVFISKNDIHRRERPDKLKG